MKISELPTLYYELFMKRYWEQPPNERRMRSEERDDDSIHQLQWASSKEEDGFWERVHFVKDINHLPAIPEDSLQEIIEELNPNMTE